MDMLNKSNPISLMNHCVAVVSRNSKSHFFKFQLLYWRPPRRLRRTGRNKGRMAAMADGSLSNKLCTGKGEKIAFKTYQNSANS